MLDLREIAARYDNLFISAITWMEALGFNFTNPKELSAIEAILGSIQVIHTDNEITRQVVTYRRIRKIKIPGTIILASAKKLGAELVTLNEDDFKGIDSNVSIYVPDLTHSL